METFSALLALCVCVCVWGGGGGDPLPYVNVITYPCPNPDKKIKDYVYGIWVYKVLGIWKCYYRVKNTSFMHEPVDRGKK